MATVRTVLLTTDTAMVGGIMVTIMYTAVNLVVIKVAAVWIDGGWLCLGGKRSHQNQFMMLHKKLRKLGGVVQNLSQPQKQNNAK